MSKYRCPLCDEVKVRKPVEIEGSKKVRCTACDIWFSALTSVQPEGPIYTKLYSHSQKDTLCEKGEELGLSEKAMEKFVYTLYEVVFDVEINRETGEVMITSVNGMELREPVKG
jgi:hypothetical protein